MRKNGLFIALPSALLWHCSTPTAQDASATDVVDAQLPGDATPSDVSETAVEDVPDDVPTVVADVPPPTPYTGPDDFCPGSAHCMNVGDGNLYVGVARQLINPTIIENQWTDSNRNNLYDPGEPFVDTNGNMAFDGTWIAGFSSGRPATGQHDDLEARAIVFRYNDTLVAQVVLDVVGLFRDDMERIRSHPMLAGLNIDHVIISSTHVHEGVDTVGLWGRTATETGVNTDYQQLIVDRAATAIRDAVMMAQQPSSRALMRPTQVLTVDAMMDPRAYVSDTRDPLILDPTMTLVQFVRESDPSQTIATWVNWAAHPEYTGSRNNELSADYVHELRRVIEEGDMQSAVTGLGGTTVFVSGALGGQVGPGDAAPLDRMNMPVREAGFDKAMHGGRNVAVVGLRALETARMGMDQGLVRGATPVSYRTAKIYARILNRVYWLGFQFNVVKRELAFFNRRLAPSMRNVPWVESRVSYFQVGPVATITAPGELHPELWVGAMDMRWSWGLPRVTEMQNPPDFARAPPPPYLRDLMLANDGVRYAFVSGLSQDFLGYIVADWNYALSPTSPYIERAAGDHYEETNSVGPDCQEHLHRPMMELARWRPGM